MTACKYGDPHCPCQDGAACHYEDCGGTKAMKPPAGYNAKKILENPDNDKEPIQCDICGDHHEPDAIPRLCETGDGE